MSGIGVVLPVYNGEKYIKQAVESILNQSFHDFILYVIEDGSKDGTLEILKAFDDDRLRIIPNDGNKGLIYSLNRGLELSRECKYIARMDADDISVPQRLQVQFDFMEQNKHIGLLGSAMQQFGESNKDKRNIYRPQEREKIASSFFFYNPFSHPTVMLRTEMLHTNFSSDFPKYEDYHLWIRLFKHMGVHNLNDILVKYRRHNNNITSSYHSEVAKDDEFIQKLITLFANNAEVNMSKEEIETISVISSRVRYQLNSHFTRDYLYSIQNSVAGKLNKDFNRDYYIYLFQERMFLYFLSLKRYKDAAFTLGKMKIRNKKRFVDSVIYKPKA